MRDQSELADCLERLVKQLMHLSEADLVEVLADLDLSFTQVSRHGVFVPCRTVVREDSGSPWLRSAVAGPIVEGFVAVDPVSSVVPASL